MENIRTALEATFKEFEIKRGEVAQSSGVSESMLSRYFAQECDITSMRLQAILNCLPAEAKSYFYTLIEPEGLTRSPLNILAELRSHIQHCSAAEFTNILGLLIEARRKVVP